MQLFVAVIALSVALVQSIPLGPQGGPESTAPIVKEDRQTSFDGTFTNNFETGNGITNQESGFVKPDGTQVIQGSNAYTAPDGQLIQTQYTADENGFQPQGSHLPTPPPIHPIILKALEYLASLPSTPEPPQAYYKPQQQLKYA